MPLICQETDLEQWYYWETLSSITVEYSQLVLHNKLIITNFTFRERKMMKY